MNISSGIFFVGFATYLSVGILCFENLLSIPLLFILMYIL